MTTKAGPSSIAADSFSALALRVSLYATGFVGSILISRALGPSGRGVYYLPVVTAATLSALASLGLEHANVYLLGNRRASVSALWAQSGLVSAVMGTFALAVALALPAVVPGVYAGTSTLLLLLACLAIPLTLHTQFGAGLLTLQGRVTWQFKAALGGSLTQVALVAAVAASRSLTVPAVLATTLASTAVTWWLIARRTSPGATWVAWDPALFRETMRQAVPLHLSSVLLFLHLRLDMFMVSAWSGLAALGLYSLAVMLAETVQLATDSLSIALLPRQVGNTLQEAAAVSLRGVRVNVLIGVGLGLGWVALGLPLIALAYGRDFLPAYVPLVVLLPGIVALGMQRACGPTVLRSGRTWGLVLLQGGSLTANALLNVWLIPRLGATGAAAASTISYALGAAVFVTWTTRIGQVAASRALPRTADAILVWRAAWRVALRGPANAGNDARK